MALRMVGLVQAKNGVSLLGKVSRLMCATSTSVCTECDGKAQLSTPGGTPGAVAKAQHGEWLAEIETRIVMLRAQSSGEDQPLTRLNAIALAGRWYNWFVKQHEADEAPFVVL
jgi:hypothetical protein